MTYYRDPATDTLELKSKNIHHSTFSQIFLKISKHSMNPSVEYP